MTNTDQADAQPCHFKDDFRGDDDALFLSTQALLELDADNALVPHGIGGHARGLLNALAARLKTTRAPEPEGERLSGRALAVLRYVYNDGLGTEFFPTCLDGSPNAAFVECCALLSLADKPAPTAQPEAEPTKASAEFWIGFQAGWEDGAGCSSENNPAFEDAVARITDEQPAPEAARGLPPESQPTAGSGEGEAAIVCAHSMCVTGPRIPLRHGDSATLICTECGAWTQDRGMRQWEPAFAFAAALCDETENDETEPETLAILRVLKSATSAAEQALREEKVLSKNRGDWIDGLRKSVAAAEQAKAQAEQERDNAILREQTTRETRELMQGERDQAEQRAQAAEADLSNAQRARGVKLASVGAIMAERDAARAEVERLTRELAEAREALRAALIPLAVLKMGQQTKPYAEHTATLTAEIAWAHNTVYAALLKERMGVINRPAIGSKIHFRGGCGRIIPAEVVGYDDDPLILYIDYRMDNGGMFHRAIIFTHNVVTAEAKA